VVVTRDGKPVTDANMDIGGMGADPDLRVPNTQLEPIKGQPGRYTATLDYPASATWVLTIRSGGSLNQVDLFTEEITGVADITGGHDSPSRRALRAIDPQFGARYDPSRLTPGEPLTAAEQAAYNANAAVNHGGGAASTSHVTYDVNGNVVPTKFDPMLLLWSFVHTLGAATWALTVFGLVVANRVGIGATRARLVGIISQRYFLLAAGGLSAVLLSGVTLAKNSPLGPGLVELKATGLGLAYLLVFTAKMTLVGAAMITSARIGVMLRRMPAPAWRLRSLAAAANDDDAAKVLKLAEANAVFVVLILGCVVALNNLHHLIH
jgi:hypothetical protein